MPHLKFNTLETIHIILVEDNEGDILLTTEVLDDMKLHIKLSIFKDGKEAIDFFDALHGVTIAHIDFILLDINLPKKNGHEVLGHINKNPSLRHIPVIMLTTSSSVKERALCLANNAYGYIIKPLIASDISALINSLKINYPGYLLI